MQRIPWLARDSIWYCHRSELTAQLWTNTTGSPAPHSLANRRAPSGVSTKGPAPVAPLLELCNGAGLAWLLPASFTPASPNATDFNTSRLSIIHFSEDFVATDTKLAGTDPACRLPAR